MGTYSALAGFWVLPNIDVIGARTRAHISVAVPAIDSFTVEDLDLALWAGDTQLAMTERPSALIHTVTRSVGAAGIFYFDNPSLLRPNLATVTLLGQQITLDVSEQDPPPLDDPNSIPMV